MALVLRKVSGTAWIDAFRLRLHPNQRRFVSAVATPVFISLLKATARGKTCLPLAAYISERRMIGFLLLSRVPSFNECWLDHFFIDKYYQGQGYGREVLARIIELACVTLACRNLFLKVGDSNDRAQRLYLSAGFEDTGMRSGRQLIFRLITQTKRGEQRRNE